MPLNRCRTIENDSPVLYISVHAWHILGEARQTVSAIYMLSHYSFELARRAHYTDTCDAQFGYSVLNIELSSLTEHVTLVVRSKFSYV